MANTRPSAARRSIGAVSSRGICQMRTQHRTTLSPARHDRGHAGGRRRSDCRLPRWPRLPRKQELEKRVAELEKMVQQLVAEKAPAAAAAAAAPAAGAPPRPPRPPPGQAGRRHRSRACRSRRTPRRTRRSCSPASSRSTPTSPTRRTASWRTTPSGRDYYIPGVTPVGRPDEGTDLNAHIKQSRINFGTDTILAGGDKLSTRFEIDFFGSSHCRPARQQHLGSRSCATPTCTWRELAGRPDLVELHGRRHAARGRGLHRPDGRHDLRAPAAGALDQGRPLAVRREPRDHDHAVQRRHARR